MIFLLNTTNNCSPAIAPCNIGPPSAEYISLVVFNKKNEIIKNPPLDTEINEFSRGDSNLLMQVKLIKINVRYVVWVKGT